MQEQIQNRKNGYSSKNLCGYREVFRSQHALISMLEKWRKSLDNKGFAGAILMDLSKAFDCMDHDLLIAKLDAYGFDKSALHTIYSYLKNRWQRVKINKSFSPCTELLLGVPQGSVLGPLLVPGWKPEGPIESVPCICAFVRAFVHASATAILKKWL